MTTREDRILSSERRINEQKLINAAKRANREGNKEAQVKALKSLKILRSRPLKVTAATQLKEFGTTAMGMADAAANVGSGAIAGLAGGLVYPVAGAAGAVDAAASGEDDLLKAFDEAGQETMAGTREAMTWQPRSERGQEYQVEIAETISPIEEGIEEFSQELAEAEFQRSGSPELATAEYIAPQALLEATSYLLAGGMAKYSQHKADKLKGRAGKAQERFNRQTDYEVEMENFEETLKTIQKADPQQVAMMIDADPRLYQLIEDLGIDVEPLAAFYSQNPQYRSIEMGLASKDASDLNIQYKEFVSAVSRKADEIIEAYGGQVNKSDLSDEVVTLYQKSIDDLMQAEDVGYTAIGKILPDTTKVDPSNTLAALESLRASHGGQLTGEFKTLYDALKPKDKTTRGTDYRSSYGVGLGREVPTTITEKVLPNYGLLNRQRKLIGQQLGRKGNTVFQTEEIGELKYLYAAMKRDQEATIDALSGEYPQIAKISEIANRNTIQRKHMEEQIIDLAGKNLDKNIVNLVGSAITRLSKGEWDKFDRVMNNLESLPKDMRGRIVLSAMNNAWSGTGASKQAFGEAQFAKFWTAIEREPKLKAKLMDSLPPSSRKSVQNLGELSQMIYKANQDKITTGRLNDFFADSGGSLNTVFTRLVESPAGTAVTYKMPIAGSAVKKLLEGSSDRALAANQMLADGRFKRIIAEAVKGDKQLGKPLSPQMKRIERDYMRSERFQNWANTLDKAERDKLVMVGVVNYLLHPKAEEL